MKTRRFDRKNVVITGGSSGIGLAVARQFVELGANVFLIGRDAARLAQAESALRRRADRVVAAHAADVARPEEVERAIREIAQSHGGLHTLINNAGTGACGRFEDVALAELQRVMDVNYWGSVHALRAAMPWLKQSGDGHVGFVSSVAGYLGAIGYSAYAPTKFAMSGLAECVRMELADHGVGTTIVYPPDTDTPMWRWEQEHTLPECKALSRTTQVVSPDSVAERFVQGIVQRRFEVFCNFESKLVRFVKTLLPRVFFGSLDSIVEKDRRQRPPR